jgi:Ca-activated chloride channel family protein
MRLHATTDRPLIRADAESTRYLLVRFTLPERPRSAPRPPLAVAVVLDRSGSMTGEKFAIARQAVDRCLGLLRPSDRSALVVFDEAVDLLQSLEPATAMNRETALARLGEIQPRGSTDLAAGWLAGAHQAGQTGGDGIAARVLLLTDGLANHGLTEPRALVGLALELRTRGVATSTFGVGVDFDERLLEGMAESGGGNFYYLERAEAMLEILTRELSDALEIVARDAAVTLDLPESVSLESPAGWPVTRKGRRVRVGLGDLVAGQEMELVLALRFPRGAPGAVVGTRLGFTDRDRAIDATDPRAAWTWASHEENERQPVDQEARRAVARAYATRARREAAELNRVDDLTGGRRVLEATARRIGDYAGSDPELQQLVVQLANEAREHVRRFEALELKQRHFAAYSTRRSRDEAGRSRRKEPPVRGA